MHANTRVILAKYVMPHITSGMRVLEVGPDFEERVNPTWETAGIDNDSRLTYHCGKYVLPITSDTFDAVVAVNVMEHVGMPWVWVQELKRVCKPGGLIALIAPANWPYHMAPVDCWRVYPDGMQSLLAWNGLAIVECRAIAAAPEDSTRFPDGVVVDTVGIGRKP